MTSAWCGWSPYPSCRSLPRTKDTWRKPSRVARAAHALVERFGLYGIPQTSLAPIALGRALAERGKLEEAQKELESGLSARRRLPGLSPWPTLIGLLALAPVRAARGDRAGGQAASPRRGPFWRSIPTPVSSPSFSNARNGRFACVSCGRGSSTVSSQNASSMCSAPRQRALHPADGAEPLRRP